MVRNEDDYELAKRFDTVSSKFQPGGRPLSTVAAFFSHVCCNLAYMRGTNEGSNDCACCA